MVDGKRVREARDHLWSRGMGLILGGDRYTTGNTEIPKTSGSAAWRGSPRFRTTANSGIWYLRGCAMEFAPADLPGDYSRAQQ